MALAMPEFLQTKQYAAMRLRQVWLDLPLQEGVVGSGDLKVAQRATGGANLSVDVAAGSAFVQGDTTSRQGLYHIYNDAIVNLAIGTNTSGNPRVDQIIARVYDSQDGLAGVDQATVEVLPGTPTAGATLDLRTGAAALPFTAVRIADVLVASGAASITNSAIRDRRPWARGAYVRGLRTAGDITRTNGSGLTARQLAIDPGDFTLYRRVELSGVPVRISLVMATVQDAAAKSQSINPYIDDAHPDVGSPPANTQTMWGTLVEAVAGSATTYHSLTYEFVPAAAGSHLVGWAFNGTGNVTTLKGLTTTPLMVAVQEQIRANASNDGS